MIIDSHAHVFQDWRGPCGHESAAVHLRYLQKGLLRPAARVFRLRDGAEVDMAALFPLGDGTWQSLRDDARFRAGDWGRLLFTVDGEDHAIQYMPVTMRRLEAPPEMLLAHMTSAGVDHCVLHAAMAYGVMNDYNALAQRQHPGRFTGLFHVDEALADTPRWLAEVERARAGLGLRGIYYQLDNFSRYDFRWTFDDARYAPFWERLAALGVVVFFDAGAIPGYDRASYVANMARLDGLMARFPALRWLLVMGPPVGFFAGGGRWDFPPEVDRVYRHDGMRLEVMFPITWGGVWDYPYPEAQALIRDLRDRYGAEKLVWGSDMPNVQRFCTYRQCLDYVRRHCDFLTGREKDLILGENLRTLLAIGAGDGPRPAGATTPTAPAAPARAGRAP